MAKTLTAGKAAGARTKQDKRAYAQLGHNTWRKAFMQHYWLYILMIPGILYMLIFNYTPMAGLVMAFEDFSPYNGDTAIQALFGSPFAGLKYFEKLFTGPDFWRLLRNTLAISLANLIFAFPAPIILALVLNELRCKWFKRFSQTLVYIPHFVSIVIVAALTYQLFSTTDGVAYHMLVQVFGKQNAPDIMSDPKLFSTMIVGQNLWKETGYGTIIYLAALSSVDTQLYEAAKIDGAGRWQLMWHVTLPAIRGTIILMLIMKVGSLLNTGYEQIFLMQNAMNRSVSDVFDTYIYTKGIVNGQYSLATAAGLFKSIVSMVMVVGANKIAKLFGESGLY
jgi:putative aldouronate transport system permease protein|uniref:ABC transporter permease n=1 Tax=Faecalibacterium sp. TaxID=1971605 RepID=UPI004025CA23